MSENKTPDKQGKVEQEPVAWRWRNPGGDWWFMDTAPIDADPQAQIEPLYGFPWRDLEDAKEYGRLNAQRAETFQQINGEKNAEIDSLREQLATAKADIRARNEHDLAPSARGEGWIPVGERLPERGVVLAVLADGEMELYQWNLVGDYANDPDPAARVTHWMPLPTKPSYVKE